MAAVLDKPTVLQRIAPVFQGFDGPLAFFILLLAAGVLFVVAQIPPQRLMAVAVPAYVVGVVLLLGVEFFGIMRKGSQRWLNVGVVIQPSEIMKLAMPLMLAWWFQRREG